MNSIGPINSIVEDLYASHKTKWSGSKSCKVLTTIMTVTEDEVNGNHAEINFWFVLLLMCGCVLIFD